MRSITWGSVMKATMRMLGCNPRRKKPVPQAWSVVEWEGRAVSPLAEQAFREIESLFKLHEPAFGLGALMLRLLLQFVQTPSHVVQLTTGVAVSPRTAR